MPIFPYAPSSFLSIHTDNEGESQQKERQTREGRRKKRKKKTDGKRVNDNE
ncbi:unnamed protein product [Fusarium graminearum]|uniref:Chromosome 1, complete genome n=1 Tax=Gibberella zeae (strain ATCC MYA-4620 / CBS 123657 / FGSC 9075 / NRRL 31084 / PH-1) TaxID=229533 RepID=A0A098DAJ3_GIBZE|nr:unnamed protein product [Fusarium graminearum]